MFSRRSFLRKGAAAAVAPPMKVVSHAGAVLTSGGGQAVLAALLQGDGFSPFYKIKAHLTRNDSCDNIDETARREILERVTGKSSNWLRYGEDPHNEFKEGTFDLRGDQKLYNALSRLPNNIPLMDILSDDVLSQIKDDAGYDDLYATLRSARKLLGPVCGADTTAGDLLKSYKKSFMQLAKRAIEKPEEFLINDNSHRGFGRYDRLANADEVRCYSDIEALKDILLEKEMDAEQTALIEQLSKAQERHIESAKKIIFRNRLEEYEQEDQQIEAKHAQKEQAARETAERMAKKQEQLRSAPDLRKPFTVKATTCEDGVTLIVHRKSAKHPTLTRVDWLQFVQWVAPETAKASDVTVFDSGLRVVFSPDVISAVKLHFKLNADTGFVTIDLPNRRVNTDLNIPRDKEKISFSM